MKILSILKEKFINLFYTKHIKCICCKGEIGKNNVYDMCENCYNSIPFIKTGYCKKCGLKFENDAGGVCLNCKANNYCFEVARSVLNFDGDVVPLIHRFKYAKYKFLAEPLAYLLYDLFILQNWKIDAICYVPLFHKREKERGYNQSRELGLCLSKLADIPLYDCLERVKDTPTQTKLTKRERKENVKDCFRLVDKDKINGANVLLIDDVYTTGSTVNEVSKVLKGGGANKVYILTVAHAGFKQKI